MMRWPCWVRRSWLCRRVIEPNLRGSPASRYALTRASNRRKTHCAPQRRPEPPSRSLGLVPIVGQGVRRAEEFAYDLPPSIDRFAQQLSDDPLNRTVKVFDSETSCVGP